MSDKPREFFDPSKVVSTKKPNDCPDCKTRVQTYLKSIDEWRTYNQQLRADLDLAIEALKNADFVLEGSVAIEGQSDAILDKREQALMSFLETLAKLQERK